MAKLITSGISPTHPSVGKPSAAITTWMPTSCSAMYGMVARMPVIAIASASDGLW